ncbi:hypothetical protein LV75_001739 [Actinokineospora diospyrosa]|uniref:Uncharacterized protein n=1 Tax=Actinokineospora diospyrosa TaxID=103728 RepID=A0ABT1IA65_9PSEU|nr:hypothetical protein [Actinokineospora diospyrosa]
MEPTGYATCQVQARFNHTPFGGGDLGKQMIKVNSNLGEYRTPSVEVIALPMGVRAFQHHLLACHSDTQCGRSLCVRGCVTAEAQ